MNSLNEIYPILLVDDEEDIRDVLKMTLSDSGHRVFVAQNGKEALELFEKHQTPIVLTDIKMPGMDGIELLRKIKAQNPEIEVMMITGHGDMDLAVKSLQYEAADFITKPINVEVLAIALNRVCEKIFMKRKLKDYTANLEALVREKTELQDHLSTLGMTIGTVSHSLKGLLTSLDGGIYLVGSGLKKKDETQTNDGLDIVKLITGRIRKMVLDILYYTKERALEPEWIELSSFADEIVDVMESKIRYRRIRIIRDLKQAPEKVLADVDCLRSALINILDNAVDACLADDLKASHKILFKIKDDEKNVVIEIHDNGIGMDSTTIDNLFKLFFSKKGGKGTGFGLYISNSIIKQHGGEIHVASAQGKGSRFCVRLPKECHQTSSELKSSSCHQETHA
jgi:signal transduction histidine kinase